MKKLRYILLAALVIVFANFYLFTKVFAYAGTLTGTSVVELGGSSGVSPMIAGDPQSLAIEFTPANSTSSAPTITTTFTGWTGGAAGSVGASGSQAASTNSCTSFFPNTPTAVPGSLTAASNTGAGTITISGATTMTAGTSYCTELTYSSAVTNPTSSGDYSVSISVTGTGGTDSQTDAIDILSTGANAYSVTGTVGSTFTMSLSGTTDNFGSNLSSSAVSLTSGITTTINTDAASGWVVWVKDSNAGLTSTQASHTIASVTTGSNHPLNGGVIGTEAYAIGAVTGTNSPTIASSYAYGGGTTGGGLSNSTYYELASHNVTANGDTFTTHELADIAATTPPATDYTDTITEIGAGSF